MKEPFLGDKMDLIEWEKKEKEDAEKKLTDLYEIIKNCEKQISEIKKHLEEVHRKAHPDEYWQCIDCKRIFKKSWLHDKSKNLCTKCRTKRAIKAKKQELKEKLLHGSIVDLDVTDDEEPELYSLVIETKDGRKIEIYPTVLDRDYDIIYLEILDIDELKNGT